MKTIKRAITLTTFFCLFFVTNTVNAQIELDSTINGIFLGENHGNYYNIEVLDELLEVSLQQHDTVMLMMEISPVAEVVLYNYITTEDEGYMDALYYLSNGYWGGLIEISEVLYKYKEQLSSSRLIIKGVDLGAEVWGMQYYLYLAKDEDTSLVKSYPKLYDDMYLKNSRKHNQAELTKAINSLDATDTDNQLVLRILESCLEYTTERLAKKKESHSIRDKYMLEQAQKWTQNENHFVIGFYGAAHVVDKDKVLAVSTNKNDLKTVSRYTSIPMYLSELYPDRTFETMQIVYCDYLKKKKQIFFMEPELDKCTICTTAYRRTHTSSFFDHLYVIPHRFRKPKC